MTSPRLEVRRTAKLYIGGAFPRSESGRSYPATTPEGVLLAHVAKASRKDVRDAVVAARAAFPGWSGLTAYHRGQVLYRVAELLEGRHAQLAEEVALASGSTEAAAAAEVAAAIDRWVWYAGWTDKLSAAFGAVNPVAGPFHNVSLPEPTGVVGVAAPDRPALLGLVSVLAPVLATGCTAVVVGSESAPLPAVTLSEVLAVADVPAGVVNLLTGALAELAPVLAGHDDVDALDLAGARESDLAELERLAAGNVKRVRLPAPAPDGAADPAPGWAADPGLDRLRSWLETKTIWHPMSDR